MCDPCIVLFFLKASLRLKLITSSLAWAGSTVSFPTPWLGICLTPSFEISHYSGSPRFGGSLFRANCGAESSRLLQAEGPHPHHAANSSQVTALGLNSERVHLTSGNLSADRSLGGALTRPKTHWVPCDTRTLEAKAASKALHKKRHGISLRIGSRPCMEGR